MPKDDENDVEDTTEETDEQDNSELIEKVDKASVEKAEKKAKRGRTFTQDDVDELIKTRLAREKSTGDRKYTSLETELKTATETIERYEEILIKQVDSQTAEIPDSVKKILGKLPVAEQLDWLADPENSINKRTSMPKTPIPRDGQKASEEKTQIRQII